MTNTPKTVQDVVGITEQDLTAEINERTGNKILSLQVRIRENVLVVTGRTSTYYSKQLVTHILIGHDLDDTLVSNEISVG